MPTSEWIYDTIQEAKEKNLITLDLSRTQLSNLPSEIGQLTNLTYLDLSNNQLGSLPSEIGQLTNLSYLDVRNNQLTNMPSEIGPLTKLNYLNLTANPLETPPIAIIRRGLKAILEFLREAEKGLDIIY